ncbi:flagellar basal body P-ring formation protein FlgA [Yoonia sp. F2084L]|uniref:flagellar basal body P-ring formation chaperone FlgA n=1 Tax=Yoonia sp. F2084L TaxID=2926419 RepID=UPI001FF551D0|nr:flagellar basal body P-ring formation chaperone FlgA [Yoonia sp. F2084L]MCK0095776.1 flagellar basal body P-ring formation protein FlgA [Yoonia sp. F2084L]
MIRLIALLTCLSTSAVADTVVAVRTIPALTVIAPEDLTISNRDTPGAASDPAQIIGLEARVALFAGRPIQMGNVGAPAVVERNQLVPLYYNNNGLIISTEGRALGRAGPGDRIRVMNTASRTTVSATIGSDGAAYVVQ